MPQIKQFFFVALKNNRLKHGMEIEEPSPKKSNGLELVWVSVRGHVSYTFS